MKKKIKYYIAPDGSKYIRCKKYPTEAWHLDFPDAPELTPEEAMKGWGYAYTADFLIDLWKCKPVYE